MTKLNKNLTNMTVAELSRKRWPIYEKLLTITDKYHLYSLGYNNIRFLTHKTDKNRTGYYLTTSEETKGEFIGRF